MRAARVDRATDPLELFPTARVVAEPERATAKGDRVVLERKLDALRADVRILTVLVAALGIVAVLR